MATKHRRAATRAGELVVFTEKAKPITDADVACLLERLSTFQAVRRELIENWDELFRRRVRGAPLEDGYLTGLVCLVDQDVRGGDRSVLLIDQKTLEQALDGD